jgi:hypothetical protein
MIHKISDVLDILDDASSGPGLASQSKAAAAYNLTGIDLTSYVGGLAFLISAGAISGGATVDFKIQHSDDNSSFADISPAVSITQITASGKTLLGLRCRQFAKRYIRGVLTVGVAATAVGVTFIGQKKVA